MCFVVVSGFPRGALQLRYGTITWDVQAVTGRLAWRALIHQLLRGDLRRCGLEQSYVQGGKERDGTVDTWSAQTSFGQTAKG